MIFRAGKLLITQRPAKAHLGGLWEFPGGKVEPGESFEQCLVRELREELGIEVAVDEVLESLTHKYPARTVHLKFFRCHLLEGEPQALGCPAFKWIAEHGLASHRFPPADARLLDRLRNSPQLWTRIEVKTGLGQTRVQVLRASRFDRSGGGRRPRKRRRSW